MKLLATLKDFQEEGVEFALRNKYSLNGDEMGLGKTIQAIAIAVRSNTKRTLFVVPAYLIPNIRNEVKKFTGEHCEDKDFSSESRFYVVSYSSLKKVEDNSCSTIDPKDF